MAVPAKRARPYPQCNWLVDLGDGDTGSIDAGFQECSNLGMEAAVAEYRAGNAKENAVMKISLLNKATDVTLKRGVTGGSKVFDWLDQVRNGDQSALRNVTIHLMSEDHNETVATWTLKNCRPVKAILASSLNAKGTDVAMEELTIAYERLDAQY
jgi:phage tail-like protein